MADTAKAFNFATIQYFAAPNTVIGVTIPPGQVNGLIKAGTTLAFSGSTLNAGFTNQVGGGFTSVAAPYIMSPGEAISTDGAAMVYLGAATGITLIAFQIISRSAGFEGTSL